MGSFLFGEILPSGKFASKENSPDGNNNELQRWLTLGQMAELLRQRQVRYLSHLGVDACMRAKLLQLGADKSFRAGFVYLSEECRIMPCIQKWRSFRLT